MPFLFLPRLQVPVAGGRVVEGADLYNETVGADAHIRPRVDVGIDPYSVPCNDISSGNFENFSK